ncbi:MAG: IS481 family transposase [Chloroflexi bacterium]|nr:IS481 family transposase [Chloroflexota bacterium]
MNNHHQNARTTFHSRVLMVKRVMEQGMSPRMVAEQLGVNASTVYKWLRRYREGGLAALPDRSSRPHKSPKRLPVERVASLAALRRMRMSSPAIALALSLPVSSVTNELRRLGLNKLSRLEPKPPVLRYEHQAPGDMVHLDIKKLGRIDGVGHRITGDRSKCKRGAGWEYLHVCVDDHSRLAYTELLPDEKATTSTNFLLRAAAWLQGYGVKVNRVLTDNGSSYRSRLFLNACQDLGARPIKTRPYTPRTNGKAERFIQTTLKEWAYKQAYESSAERKACLPVWLHDYNYTRPHASLNHKPPISRLDNCAQPV